METIQKNPISTIRKDNTEKIHAYVCGYFSKFLIEYKIEKENINIRKVNTSWKYLCLVLLVHTQYHLPIYLLSLYSSNCLINP